MNKRMSKFLNIIHFSVQIYKAESPRRLNVYRFQAFSKVGLFEYLPFVRHFAPENPERRLFWIDRSSNCYNWATAHESQQLPEIVKHCCRPMRRCITVNDCPKLPSWDALIQFQHYFARLKMYNVLSYCQNEIDYSREKLILWELVCTSHNNLTAHTAEPSSD